MYRIELAPGEETALRTIDELAAGIRSGVITSRARIWHNAGQKWLPIEFHPHYKAALQKQDAEVPVTTPPIPEPVSALKMEAGDAAGPIPTVSERPRSALRSMTLAVTGIITAVGAWMVVSALGRDEARSSVDRMAATAPASAPGSVPADSPVQPSSAHTAMLAKPVIAGASSSSAPTTAALNTPVTDTPNRALGGVVHGPSTSALPPSRPKTPPSDDEALPEIAPAPVVTTELPALPVDTLK